MYSFEKTGKETPELQLRSVSLELGGRRVLQDISLEIWTGECLAIVGAVGSGKSVLFQLLMGFFSVQSGFYTIRQQPASSLTHASLRQMFVSVPQNVFLINGSLRDNVHFVYQANPSLDHDVLYALNISQFLSDLSCMKNALNTEIGERGVNLSGGQRQRVGLARAVFNKQHFFQDAIVLLDDSLSALDVNTEQDVCKNLLFGEWKQTTRLLATHRLQVLNQCDRVLFLNAGKIEALGTFADVCQKCPAFLEYIAEQNQDKIEVL